MLGANNVSFILVFLEGLLSFFSPCVIPLIPLYMGYLAGGGKKVDDDGTITYDRKKVFLHTLFFILGISFSFFILGISFTTLGRFFNSHKLLFTRAGGILIILLGLFQIGVLDFTFLQRERKIHMNLMNKEMNPLIAIIMGFTFSFAWTPCIGPALSSVLIMASGAKTSFAGYMLVFVYAIGFLIPFLILGLFTSQALNFLKAKRKLIKYTVKIGGAILIIMGIMILTGWMNGISGYLNSSSSKNLNKGQVEDRNSSGNKDSASNNDKSSEGKSDTDKKRPTIPAFDFTLTDQYGNEHTLSDYKGKVVFLNFWATWCPPCRKEMPDIEELYKEYNFNKDEVVFLGVANPSSKDYPNNQDVEKDDIISFLEENGYSFPTVFDESGEVLHNYNISAFPTTFMIDKEGNIYGYVPGMMTKDIMLNVIEETLKGSK
ncbi:Thiol-disulfide oxidoreductase ResA [Clostridium sp. N3C]|uniref:cytochrome c biogenesis protein/redoxin n=1 Tax=Clostridium sp. N3C TaxID=1776758 RepID=UPI00092E0E20|nr:cytochrome c biogenesis protein/redoxin [Clostridium sp. N3C]SCN26570.1 Thiol-disulfide oxidoreductase ResA [Clostridium sp. N3C]